MTGQTSDTLDEMTLVKAMTNLRQFAEIGNLNAVLIEEEEAELKANEVRQQMAKKSEVIADMQNKMNQVIALMMKKEASTAVQPAVIVPPTSEEDRSSPNHVKNEQSRQLKRI
ncbi:unnamed protein product [Linum trigynum]|uniref:Uncharacterized protein n=1 Tax=Linum trigynum TaxID=586398 RepID=A0AAV2FUH2_9ROSI